MTTVGFKIINTFFDRDAVINAVPPARRRVLSKAGAFIRRTARGSIRRRRAVSEPGSPPSAHSTDATATIKNILFGYDARSESVVIGPVGLNVTHVVGGSYKSGAVPHVLEFGGTLGIPEHQRRDGTWTRSDLRSRRNIAGKPQRIRQARYRPRPFMAPALRQNLPKFPGLWRNSIVRSA